MKKKAGKDVKTLTHGEASRTNIPTAEHEPVMADDERRPIQVAYERRNPDLDPQLVWRGKEEQNWSDLVVQAPPLFIQEKVHPKALISDLLRRSQEADAAAASDEEGFQFDIFADFNGLPDHNARTEFYQHDANWSNRMILGDSLQVMASLAEREGLRGKVQCIYLDPPYGIKFNSNFQWSTTSREVTDGRANHITREPEQVKAFRDTWRDGIHSYLTYLRDRLSLAHDLLAESGAIFCQIGDENVHRVRAVMDEVFGEENFVTEILVKKKGSQISGNLESVNDFILFYAKAISALKFRKLWEVREGEEIFEDFGFVQTEDGSRVRITELEREDRKAYRRDFASFKCAYPRAKVFALNPLKSGGYRKNQSHDFHFRRRVFPIGDGQCWKHTVVSEDGSPPGMDRLGRADRLFPLRSDVRFIRYSPEPSIKQMSNWWDGLGGASAPVYIVQTSPEIVKRCILMVSDPGDLVMDPTCGSGTTAFVAEQWGRRWITIDTSRVALALTRARIMGGRFAYYLLADSPEGQAKEAEIRGTEPSQERALSDIRQGFVYERARTDTSGAIANNTEVDVIWERSEESLETLREELNSALGQAWEEWEIPRKPNESWNAKARGIHAQWLQERTARQEEIDDSIAAKADVEYLYDKPYAARNIVRVAGPFTVESISPHRVLGVDENDELIDQTAEAGLDCGKPQDFASVILEHLKTSGVQQANKEDRIEFSSLTPWPGEYVCAEGRYVEGGDEDGAEKRAAIFIGPEFGTVTRPDLVAATREAADAGYDVLVACAFNFEAHASDFNKLGKVPVLKARMNADLHMADNLKNTGKGNLFVIFGEPDIDILPAEDDGSGAERFQVKVNGVDVFDPTSGEVRSDDTDSIACWFLDTDYDEESFFVRHAYFLGANDPYKALKSTLKAEINEEAWATLKSDVSRPFERPSSGRIAVKVINHLGDEVMKVFRV